jgi:hypothetical protein
VKRITTTVYNGKSDPIQGDTPDCASEAPLLPDGRKITVVCRRITRTFDSLGRLSSRSGLQ